MFYSFAILSIMEEYVKVPTCLKNPLVVPSKTLMGPGPSNASPRILHALCQPVLGHMHPELFKIMDDIKQGIQYIFQTKNDFTLAISASGHAGMETVLCNLLEPGDTVLILVNGIWGERAANMAERYGFVVRKLRKSTDGDIFSLMEIENAVINCQPKLIFVVQGESSTGICQPLEGIGEIARRYNSILAVDTVASLGAVPFYMDQWKIDVVYSGSQKVIGVPPGLSPVSFNDRAKDVIFNRKTPVCVYYWDMKHLGLQWNCFQKDLPRIYHHTTSSNLLYALREGLAIISEEGLENVIRRHRECSSLLYKGIESLGLEFFVEEEHKRLPSVTTIKVPDNVDWKKAVDYAMRTYKLEISGGLGPTAGKVFRIGLMGYNATPDKVKFTLEVLRESLQFANTSIHSSKL